MKQIKTAIFGTGFMGRVHLEAVRRGESVEAVGLPGRSAGAARRLGTGFSVPTITTDYRALPGGFDISTADPTAASRNVEQVYDDSLRQGIVAQGFRCGIRKVMSQEKEYLGAGATVVPGHLGHVRFGRCERNRVVRGIPIRGCRLVQHVVEIGAANGNVIRSGSHAVYLQPTHEIGRASCRE